MVANDITRFRPAPRRAGKGTADGTDTQAKLRTLYARWDQFSREYDQARQRNDQEVMTNLRGLMLTIKREISRLGGDLKEFPYPDEPHLADL